MGPSHGVWNYRRPDGHGGNERSLTDAERALFTGAHEYIADGRLPSAVPKSLGAGRGTAETCSLCGLNIDPAHVEYEMTGPSGAMFHFPHPVSRNLAACCG
jgi:hypothetical protein